MDASYQYDVEFFADPFCTAPSWSRSAVAASPSCSAVNFCSTNGTCATTPFYVQCLGNQVFRAATCGASNGLVWNTSLTAADACLRLDSSPTVTYYLRVACKLLLSDTPRRRLVSDRVSRVLRCDQSHQRSVATAQLPPVWTAVAAAVEPAVLTAHLAANGTAVVRAIIRAQRQTLGAAQSPANGAAILPPDGAAVVAAQSPADVAAVVRAQR